MKPVCLSAYTFPAHTDELDPSPTVQGMHNEVRKRIRGNWTHNPINPLSVEYRTGIWNKRYWDEF